MKIAFSNLQHKLKLPFPRDEIIDSVTQQFGHLLLNFVIGTKTFCEVLHRRDNTKKESAFMKY